MDSVKAELHTFVDDPMDPTNNYNMGVKYYSAEQYAAAFSHFMRASERSDDTRFAARSLLYASKSMGLQGGRDAKELDLIYHALSIGYKYPEVHCIKAMYHSWRKDWTQCYAACCMALELIDTYEVDEPFLDYSGKEIILNQKAMAEYNRARYNDSRATYNSILEMDISDCLRRQIQNKMKKFPEPYSEPITWDYNHSQIFQDVFVETVMNKKDNGTYLEIGSGNYKFGNNTLMLEEKYGWKGISLEWNKDLVYKFNMNRVNKCICGDATKVDYTEILKDLPSTIDYLQLDCDPPSVTFEILKRIPFDTHQFNVITYEHDYYNDPTKSFRQKSRDYLTSKGYILAVGDVTADREEQMNFEDWWVHPRVASSCPRIHTQGPICGERYFKSITSNTFETIRDDTSNKNPKVCWGFCSPEKAAQIQKYIKDICHTHDNPVCVEIGVFGGMSCIPVLIELHRAEKGILHAIDPWDNVEATVGYNDAHYDWWKNVDLNKVYNIFKNIISKYNFTKFVNIVKLPSNDAPKIDNINYLYIDGQHTEQAFKDIDKYATNIVEDGILILDDIGKDSFSMVMKDLPEYAIQLGFKKIDEVGDAFVFKKTSKDSGLYNFNPCKSSIKDNFEFYPCHDQSGNDMYHHSSSTIDDLLVSAYNDSNCAAVNTYGYFKSSVDKVSQVGGWYRPNGDGVYIKNPVVETKNYSSEIPVMGVLICTTTKWLKKQLDSIDYPIENYIIINNNAESLKDDVDSIISIKHPFIKKISVLHMPYNTGCADGWNTIIKSFMFAPYWVITNDDISFQPGFLQEMNEAAQDEEVGMVHGKPVNLTNLTHLGTLESFLIKDWVIQSHGLFDSNYYPAYFEDCDYFMRLLNKPIKVINQLKHSFYHGDTADCNEMGGNSTIKANNQSYMRLTYAKYQNYEYFVKKWNTFPEHDCSPWKTPFNDPSLPLSYTSFDLKFARGKHLRNSLNLHTPTPIQPPKYLPTSITIDNFYDDPDEVREYALGLEYQPEENHGAVGFRCEAGRRILPGTRELFEKYLGRKIKNWDVHRTNGCFQWCPETTRIVYHCDQTTYAAIIFLTPDAPPEAGLSLCRHKKYKIMDNSIFQKSDWYSPNRGYKEPHTDQTPWERVDKIGNVYNRLVLFNAHHVHAVSEYFGDQIHNSRLFQLFFFDI